MAEVQVETPYETITVEAEIDISDYLQNLDVEVDFAEHVDEIIDALKDEIDLDEVIPCLDADEVLKCLDQEDIVAFALANMKDLMKLAFIESMGREEGEAVTAVAAK